MADNLAHSWRKPGSTLFYFRRRVPGDIQSLLAVMGSPDAGKARIVVSLKTSDPKVAAQRIARLVRQTDEQWHELRNPTRANVLRQAHQLLLRHGVDPADAEANQRALDAFFKKVMQQLPEGIREELQIADGSQLDRYLLPIYRAALEVAQNRREFTVTDCLEEYVAARPATEKHARIAFGYLTAFLKTDCDIRKVRRKDVNGFVAHLLAGEHSIDGSLILKAASASTSPAQLHRASPLRCLRRCAIRRLRLAPIRGDLALVSCAPGYSPSACRKAIA